MLLRVASGVAELQAPSSSCEVLETLHRRHCYGLTAVPGISSSDLCSASCCAQVICEVWQYHPDEGCFQGRPHTCAEHTNSHFSNGATGARLRQVIDADRIQSPDNAVDAEMIWVGDRNSFATYEPIEPYASIYTQQFQVDNGHTYIVRRSGPKLHQMDVSISCWAQPMRTPDNCCGPGVEINCWSNLAYRERCCTLGFTEMEPTIRAWHDVYLMISADMQPSELRMWDSMVPKIDIDEEAFLEKRLRWRVGSNEPGWQCAYTSEATGAQFAENGINVDDSPAGVRGLFRFLQVLGVEFSHTFVNIGAGTCEAPDPVYHLLQSPEGAAFRGLAVDGNLEDLKQCRFAADGTGQAIAVHATIDPITVRARLRNQIRSLFGPDPGPPPWPLDILVVDIDSCDCLVTEELLQLVQPKILVLELVFHIPPPFRFSLLYDAVLSEVKQDEYDVEKFNAASGCSLSYALHHFRPYGMHLFRLTDQDGVFVHESVVPLIERALSITFPQDEFLCFRQSRLWMQFPALYVREWFFEGHPSASLGRIWSNLSRGNALVGHPKLPFVLDY